MSSSPASPPSDHVAALRFLICQGRILLPREQSWEWKYKQLVRAVINYGAGGRYEDLIAAVKATEGTE
jgi:hypothetical protein